MEKRLKILAHQGGYFYVSFAYIRNQDQKFCYPQEMVLLELQVPTVTSSTQNLFDFFVNSGSESHALSSKQIKRGVKFLT